MANSFEIAYSDLKDLLFIYLFIYLLTYLLPQLWVSF